MISWVRKKILKINKFILDNLEGIIVSCYTTVFFLFVIYSRSNPDEYLYLSIANSFVDAIKGDGEIGDIDTWHTPLLPVVLAIFKWISGVSSFFVGRIIITLFSIGSVILLYKLFQKLFVGVKTIKLRVFVLLLMFPGFFYFGSMILLDNIAFFFFVLLVYYIVSGKEHWKIGIVLAILSLAKEYYLVLGGFVIFIAITHDFFFKYKKETILKRCKIFVQNLLSSYWLAVAVLVSILLFPVLPYASLLGTFMLEIFGDKYAIFGGMFNDLMFSHYSYGELIHNGLGIIKETAIGFKSGGAEINSVTSFSGRIFATRETPAGFIAYFNRTFKEVYLNIYIVPLSLYGMYVYFTNNKERWSKNGIVVLSVFIAFILFFSRTAHLGLGDFRFAFIVIIPFLFFSTFAVKDLLETSKFRFRHYVFVVCTIIYTLVMLGHIRHITSGGVLYASTWVQLLVKYKYVLNIILYIFPIAILFLNWRMDTKRKIFVVWLIIIFAYKNVPLLLEGYMIEQRSSIEYNLTEAEIILNRVEIDNPIVLTNYRRAYYYYSDSDNLPNNVRKNLPIIRPKPNVIHEERVIGAKDYIFLSLSEDYLCSKNIKYIFYVNREFNDKSDIVDLVTSVKGVSIKKDFYEKNVLSWGLYEFDNKICK